MIWVTRRAVDIRYNKGASETQDQWTFGQILPLAVLIYPFVSLIETLLPLYMRRNNTGQSYHTLSLAFPASEIC